MVTCVHERAGAVLHGADVVDALRATDTVVAPCLLVFIPFPRATKSVPLLHVTYIFSIVLGLVGRFADGADCLEGSNEVKNVAMEILGHLAGMAESLCPFQPHQVRPHDVLHFWLFVSHFM